MTYSPDHPEYKALLGTPNASGAAYLLLDHGNALGLAGLGDITVENDSPLPDEMPFLNLGIDYRLAADTRSAGAQDLQRANDLADATEKSVAEPAESPLDDMLDDLFRDPSEDETADITK